MSRHAHHESTYTIQAPRHPVSQLQGPFEESMLESAHDESDSDVFYDPIARRNMLLESSTYTRIVAGRWKQKPGERFHPLWKLIAQISFGIYLLSQGMARSEDEVMQILQAHVDEIDGFLERTTEDFDLAQEDIQERLRCLKLPLSHPATFDRMLEDRNFRLSIVEGNEKIEHIVERTSQAMKDSLKDVQKGFDSTSCLEKYLQELSTVWIRETVEHEAVFVAMLGNVEGWRKAFMSLHMQGNKLGGSLKKLTDIINEMQARAGEVSRRLLHQARVQHQQVMGRPTGRNTPSTGRNTPTSRFQSMPNKKLPTMPERPSLRSAASHDTVNTATSTRTNSQETLRQQVLRQRSQTPQHEMPAPQHLRNGASPRIVQIGSNSQARVQSMVPSLMEAAPSPQTSQTLRQPQVDDTEEQPERYFPPVELPAHVPEETMRSVPMSKQNRLSVGLGLKQTSQADKRTSRVGSSALVDLLRSDLPVEKFSETSRSTSSEGPSRSFTTPPESSVDDTLSAGFPVKSGAAEPHPSSVSDTSSNHANANIRRPRKSDQPWVEALDDDLNNKDKFSLLGNDSSRVGSPSAPPPNASDHGSAPGTPSWAKTTFVQAENKELLKKGAFSSHPSNRPLGSPPVNQTAQFTNPLSVGVLPRRSSHASSAGRSTIGEPGPEVAASEAGTMSAYSENSAQRNAGAMKRASAYAPEVVSVVETPPIPQSRKAFIAEMEGDSPVVPGALKHPRDTRAIIMELEAPQQTFRLPPRPPPAKKEEAIFTVVESAQLLSEMQGGEQTSATDVKVGNNDQGVASKALPVPESGPDLSLSIQVATSRDRSAQVSNPEKQPEAASESGKAIDDDHNTINHDAAASQAQALLSDRITVSTPDIPLPASPCGPDSANSSAAPPPQQAPEETLYMLPALAYKPPTISPRLPPDPVLAMRHFEVTLSIPESAPDLETAPMGHVRDESGSKQDGGTILTLNRLTAEATAAPEPTNCSPVDTSSSVFESPLLDSEPIPLEHRNDIEVTSPPWIEPQSSTTEVDTGFRNINAMQRDHRPAELQHVRNNSSHGSRNGWKAFFTGKPSPVGSNLSIRSIKRESLMEQPKQSPALLSPASGPSHRPMSSEVKDVVWFNNPLTKTVDTEHSEENINTPRGLGIMTETN